MAELPKNFLVDGLKLADRDDMNDVLYVVNEQCAARLDIMSEHNFNQ